MTLSHLAPFVDVSRKKYIKRLKKDNIEENLNLTEEQIKAIAEKRVIEEIKNSIQTLNYQISTLFSTNGEIDLPL